MKVLISGAGIAGLTVAYWLKRYGFTPTLIEKHPELRAEGYKIDIRGKAVEVIKRMGLLPAIYEARTQIREARFVDDSGKLITQTTPDLCGVRSDGDLEIVRGSLCQILYQHIGDTECLFGESIKSISEKENGVDVEFEKNGTRQFDLVIGADGLHSKVRKLAFGDESQFLRELGLYVSFYSIPNYLQLDRVEIEYFLPKRFMIAYCPRDGMAKAGFAFSAKPGPYDLRKPEDQKKLLAEAFTDAGWEAPRFLKLMKEAPDFYFDCMAQIHMPHCTKGRIALIGDAGYAVSPIAGQGASVALVGAYVLAGELAGKRKDYKNAFLSYEANLKEFVKKNQDLAKMSGDLMSAPLWVIKAFLRLMPKKWIHFFKNLGLRKTKKAANAIELKAYEKNR
jgi:2-polyprenyl-6-methoxyphenol hydroxylase-like FAD-dependent oxidoreductase